ncbi:MAG TPA: sulfatase [Anaerohalosphaeraceae bacterium]|jgi:arylsulfatase A|nr:sulfatase [Anaerohalosphaeraceae bacterium]HRT50273.1 sulfatase [Anaerohalosphaeraceae bacterium]HRT86206.1 sulfatase [Anaerohalosphaeraceae bacterium]
MHRRDFLKGMGASLLAAAASPLVAAQEKRGPNFVIIYADDLGYGDLGCFGNPVIRTPNLDRMAAEGAKLTQFYSAASVCTPSRAALMTGRLPVRNGMCSDKRAVLFPDSGGGLPQSEVTIARLLKSRGYATCCVGKWHLGHLPQFLPTSHGFDYYYGIPYSNDMDRVDGNHRQQSTHPTIEQFNVPLMRNEEVIERPADQNTITRRYTEEAVAFIRRSKEKPFFLYLAHTMVHVPLFASADFRGKSLRGIYGDAMQEVDWSVGRVLDTLRAEGLAENTLVIFSSDNGPWLVFKEHGGSAGPFRDGKGSTWEGGMRVPTIAWWPGAIKPQTVITDMASTLDVLPTFADLAGADLPADRVYDGWSMVDMLTGKGKGKRSVMFYYRGTQLRAVRKGPWKIHLYTKTEYVNDTLKKHDPPLLFNVERDPSESHEVGAQHPRIIEDLKKEIAAHVATLKPVPSQLEIPLKKA